MLILQFKPNFLVLILLCLTSCLNDEKTDYVHLSVKIQSKDFNKVYISKGIQTKDTILLSLKGEFVDSLNIPSGIYHIDDGKNKIPLYLEEGSKLEVDYNPISVDNSLKYNGINASINYYLWEKKKLQEKIGTHYKKEEDQYKKIYNDIFKILNEKLDTIRHTSSKLIELEKRNITYEYLNNLYNYKNLHGIFSNQPDYKVSKNFIPPVQVFIVNNLKDYNNLNSYQELAENYFNDKVQRKIKNQEVLEIEAFREVADEIFSQKLRNHFIFNYTKSKLLDQEKTTRDLYYNLHLELSSNPDYKKDIENIYDSIK